MILESLRTKSTHSVLSSLVTSPMGPTSLLLLFLVLSSYRKIPSERDWCNVVTAPSSDLTYPRPGAFKSGCSGVLGHQCTRFLSVYPEHVCDNGPKTSYNPQKNKLREGTERWPRVPPRPPVPHLLRGCMGVSSTLQRFHACSRLSCPVERMPQGSRKGIELTPCVFGGSLVLRGPPPRCGHER